MLQTPGETTLATRRKDRNRAARKGAQVRSPLRDLIDRIGPEIADENCVLFVGAGSSTEKWSRGHSFYTTIRAMTSLSETDSDTFPAVMQKFCDERDGGHHNS
jgi:hypothetical protein